MRLYFDSPVDWTKNQETFSALMNHVFGDVYDCITVKEEGLNGSGVIP